MEKDPSLKLPTHIVALNYFSLVFILSGIALSYSLTTTIVTQTVTLIAWVYLLPPLLARVIILISGKPTGLVSTQSRTHTIWWTLFQLQLIFNRFPFLEEILKTIPGLYALWLNLWGAKVSLFAFWAPGVIVMDRYHLTIGKGAILGTGSLISAHVLFKRSNGDMFLVIDNVTIESDVLIGVHAKLAPGCHIYPSQIVPANKLLKPYSEIKDGKSSILKSIDYR